MERKHSSGGKASSKAKKVIVYRTSSACIIEYMESNWCLAGQWTCKEDGKTHLVWALAEGESDLHGRCREWRREEKRQNCQ